MNEKLQKAENRLKEMAQFASSPKAFEAQFWDSVDKSKKDEAFSLILHVMYQKLTQEGERFNEVFSNADEADKKALTAWLDSAYRKMQEKK